MLNSTTAKRLHRPAEAPLTLAEPPVKLHGFLDQFGLWSNLGISLLVPVVVAFFVPTSFFASVTAIVLGSVLGCSLIGAVAAIGAGTSQPTMVIFRGLFGRFGSYLPTVLNIAQCLGWATFEIWIISYAAHEVWHSAPRWTFVLGAGLVATAMALRPLGSTQILKRIAVVVVVACTAYFLFEAARRPLGPLASGGWSGLWTNVDLVISMSVSWVPLVADYSRHGRSRRVSGLAVGLGYGIASAAFFLVGLLGILAFHPSDGNVIGALLAVPAGAVALAILAVDELDQAFANVYSTAVSVQNIAPRADRRALAVGIGALATFFGLLTTNGYSYQGFLLLIGAVFTPLGAVLVVDYFVVRRGDYDLSADSPARPWMLAPWVCGFVAFELVSPTYVQDWTSWQDFWRMLQRAVGLSATNGWSASVVAFIVAGVLTLAVGRLPVRASKR